MYEKAVIEIENKQVEEVVEKEVKTSLTSSSGLSGFAGITQKLEQAAKKMASEALSSIVPGLGDMLTGEKEQFEVQFNPKELEIQGSSKKGKSQTGTGAEHENIDYGSLGSKVMVKIPLIFDKTEEGSSIISINLQKSKGKTVSVAPDVEHFLQSVRNPFSRTIRFSWGNMLYQGQLASVSAQYTMFSREGQPIRANVNLEILCDYSYNK